MSIIPVCHHDAVKQKLKQNCDYNSPKGCWIWSGTPDKNGNLRISIKIGDREQWLRINVTRASYIVHKGEIPPRRHVAQTCGNKFCVNPAHLFAPGEGGPQLNIEAVYVSVCRLGHCARAVDVAGDMGLDASRETLEAVELLLENPDHFKPLVKSGRKYYQAI